MLVARLPPRPSRLLLIFNLFSTGDGAKVEGVAGLTITSKFDVGAWPVFYGNYDKQKEKQEFTNGAPVFNEELDDLLFEYLQSEWDARPAVSNGLLAEEVLRIADSLSACISRP